MGTLVTAAPTPLLTSSERLGKIDKLRETNTKQYVPLPQLVAVGDQSSGKSSLLEGLTGIPFPRSLGACTRYATQISHRRGSEVSIKISIIPASGASDDEKENLKNYKISVQTASELQEQLPNILVEVNKVMGIHTDENPEGTRTFSENVLKIEKCGPNEDYLTVIDVPGIIRATEDDAVARDIPLVRNIVENYIRDDQTIILAVLPCTADIETQEILTLAKKIRSKWPADSRRGADDKGQPLSDEQRDSMFKKEPWCHLPQDQLGVVALRQRLQQLLGDLVDRAYPKLRAATKEMLAQATSDLQKLGESRQTERELQRYLSSIASDFQDIVRPALNADYSSSELFDDEKFRLITSVLNLTDDFKKDFTETAHKYQFLERGQDSDQESGSGDSNRKSGSDEDTQPCLKSDFAKDDIKFDQYPDLKTVITQDKNSCSPESGIMNWIRDLHRHSRGSELTSYNASLFAGAVRKQTSKWRAYTEFFVSKIVYKIHEFIVQALEAVCPDTKVRGKLLSHLLKGILERYEAAMDQVRMLLEVERGGQPYTLNSAFREALSNLQSARMNMELSPKLISVEATGSGESAVSLDNVQSTLRDKNSGKHIAEEVHDLLKSYYEVARDRFIDNIYLQVIAHNLVFGTSSPLRLFCEKWVLDLDYDKLKGIGGETLQTSEQRKLLKKKVKALEEAVDILQ
ncbi:hypothetical protein NQ176_g3317 [Zarea fungicola]|uniref:Uncharacterized protein n=1 Tax=Zarea fungicola TaxID=93591 RepID=A0ACC1NLW3_9HYPO|nr:hypothetical protein NQ176_g3317 [Lecanicillium fungicola]